MYKWLPGIAILIWCGSSCIKTGPDCSGNCADIRLSGRITDTATGKGVANVPVQVIWKERGSCLFCDEINVAGSKTDGDGYFNFRATVSKDKFANDYYLSVAASLPAAYLQSGDFAYISQYTPDTANLNLTAFPKANLTVKLVKNQPDSLIYYDFVYYFSPYGRVGLFTGEPMSDTTFQVETAADIYTKFEWTKYYSPGNYVLFSDSIICSAKHENVFTLTF